MQPAQNSQEALTNLQSYQAKMYNPADVLQNKMDTMGATDAGKQVSGLRQAITNTTNLLNQIPKGVMGRTQNSLVTNAQANRQIQNESAPVSHNLEQQNQAFGNATDEYGRLIGLATNSANAFTQGQQQELSNYKNLYDQLYGREQDAAKLAEQQRQFNEQMSAAKRASGGGSSGGGGGFSLGGGASGGGTAGSAAMTQRGDKGFNFTDASGRAISAAAYAQAKGIPFRDLLTEMANAGDQGSRTALGFVGNDFGYDPRKLIPGVSSPQMLNLYKSLVWG